MNLKRKILQTNIRTQENLFVYRLISLNREQGTRDPITYIYLSSLKLFKGGKINKYK